MLARCRSGGLRCARRDTVRHVGAAGGGHAVEGIREVDPQGPVLLIGAKATALRSASAHEAVVVRQEEVEEIFVHDAGWYQSKQVELAPARR